MNARNRAILLLASAASTVQAQCAITLSPAVGRAFTEVIVSIQTIGYPIGFIMMIYMGVRWFLAEGPEDRENARRGVIYIIIGIMLLRTADPLINYLLCWTP
jgi:hypothetical protein